MAGRGSGDGCPIVRRRAEERDPRWPGDVGIEARRAAGVELQSGERISARAVAANVPPKLLFRDLVPEGAVDPDLRRRFIGLKSGSGAFRMNMALSELPDFTCRPGRTLRDHHGSGIVIGPTLDYSTEPMSMRAPTAGRGSRWWRC